MGIVVCLLLGVTLMLLKPLSQLNVIVLSKKMRLTEVLVMAIFIVGCWNAFVYGLSKLDQFWGVVAFGSGAFMIVASLVVYLDKKTTAAFNVNQKVITISQWVLSIGVLCFFLLYLVTLIRLNLGLSIPE